MTENSPDMRLGKTFQLLSSPTKSSCAPRLGQIALPGRRVIQTPNYTAVTSRGAVPHLTPDNLRQHTTVGAAYLALEDCELAPVVSGAPRG